MIKTKLKAKKKIYHVIDVYELDQFINDTKLFPCINYSIVASERGYRDTALTFEVGGKDYYKDNIEKLMKGEHVPYGTYDVLNYLADKGFIHKGNYLVNVL